MSTKNNARCTLVRPRLDHKQNVADFAASRTVQLFCCTSGSDNSVFRCCRSSVLLLLTGYQAQSTADQQCQQMNGEGRGCSAAGGWAGDSVLLLRLLRHLRRFTLVAVNASHTQTVNTHRTQQHNKLSDVTASISKLVSIQQNSVCVHICVCVCTCTHSCFFRYCWLDWQALV